MNKHNPTCVPPSPSVVTTLTKEGLKGLANVFVHVVSNNTTYYVDPCHNITITFSGDVYVDGYDPTANPLGLAMQTAYDFANNKAYVFNAAGEYRTLTLEGGE